MDFFADPSLPGLGELTGAFARAGGDVLAVCSAYRLLTEPPARAAYGGQRLRYRVGLYRRGERRPFAAFDHLRYGVNDVAFHPSLPLVAIAAGSYDGGWCFEGELALWNWETGERGFAFQQTPAVVRVAFEPGGDIVAYVSPWNEGVVEQLGGADPFDIFYELRASFLPALTPGLESAEDVARQMQRQSPVSGTTVRADSRFRQSATDAAVEVRRRIGLSALQTRSPVWDLAFLPGDLLSIVHDDCHLQVLARDGTIATSFTGEGHGCEVYGGANPFVHVTRGDWRSGFEFSSTLFCLVGRGLRDEASFPGRHTFSRAADGRMLGRRDRVGLKAPGVPVNDQHCSGGVWHELDLGRYDVFNHYLRVDDAPHLFFVQDDSPVRDFAELIASPPRKWVCVLAPDGSTVRLWQLLRNDGTHASQAMECTFAFVKDDAGESMVVAGKHYEPNASRSYSGFMYRRRLRDGEELWRLHTSASPTVIRHVPSAGVILAFFLNGEEIVLRADTGNVLRRNRFEPDGLPSVVFSCAVSADRIAVGTVDGRVGVSFLSDFLQ